MDPREADLRRRARLGSAAIPPPSHLPLGRISLAWFAAAFVETSAVARRLPWKRSSPRRRFITRVVLDTVVRLVVADPILRWSARESLRGAEVEREGR
jgi:hypothetical protein